MRGLRSGRVSMSLRRGAIGLLLAILAIPILGVSAAHAQNYQYWGYYNWTDGSWKLAQKGPASVVPEDGEVDGWHFAIGMDKPRPPRADGDFDAICKDTSAPEGKKRVAVVLDYGLSEEAPKGDEPPEPRGACAVVGTKASSAQVLSAVAEVRTKDGLTCGIDGYPSSGCSQEADQPADVTLPEPQVELQLPKTDDARQGSGGEASGDGSGGSSGSEDAGRSGQADGAQQTADEDPGGPPVWGIVAIALIVLIGAGALITRLRGRSEAS